MSSTVTGTGSGSTTGNGSDVITATVAVVDETGEPGGKKKKTTKRRKVNHACLYCRRSHMTCDEGRPCQRWCVAFLFLIFDLFYFISLLVSNEK